MQKLEELLDCPIDNNNKIVEDLMEDLKDGQYHKLEKGVKKLYAIVIFSVGIAITSFCLSYYLFPILLIDLLWSLVADTNKTLSRNVKITKALSYLLFVIAATTAITAFTYSLPIIILIEMLALANLVAKRFIYEINLLGSQNMSPNIQKLCYKAIKDKSIKNWDDEKKFCIYFMMTDPKLFMYNLSAIKMIQSNGYNVLPVFNDSDDIDKRKIACDTIKNKDNVEKLQNKKVDLLYINSHGDQEAIDNFWTIGDNMEDLVEPDCKIVLHACQTAANGQDSIAAKIAKDNPGCKVYASNENIRDMKMDKNDQVFFEGVNEYMRFQSQKSFILFCKDKNSEVVIEENNPKSKGWKLF